ncbi:hypothetical protein X474_05490 [Dethiosulfatarculus sandiegensis]|uniref:Uncharacterized protein n=1 Tax=Dethiosulfatarculus sandiegensis TaxID=1429043 RepID=A0A0D2JHL6_9BACT|nr:hypothetical protein X474_05490 [Dethiosulfatarculus sandiegensis]
MDALKMFYGQMEYQACAHGEQGSGIKPQKFSRSFFTLNLAFDAMIFLPGAEECPAPGWNWETVFIL